MIERIDQPAAGDGPAGRAGRDGVAERLVVPGKPGNAGGGKEPQFRTNAESGEGQETEAVRIQTDRNTEWMDAGDMVRCLNQKPGGWTNYFKLGPVTKAYRFPQQIHHDPAAPVARQEA